MPAFVLASSLRWLRAAGFVAFGRSGPTGLTGLHGEVLLAAASSASRISRITRAVHLHGVRALDVLGGFALATAFFGFDGRADPVELAGGLLRALVRWRSRRARGWRRRLLCGA